MNERLDAAIDSYRNDAAKQWLYENPKVETLLGAARAYRDLLANGERVEWCGEHQEGRPSGVVVCRTGAVRMEGCRLVSKIIIDLPTEEE